MTASKGEKSSSKGEKGESERELQLNIQVSKVIVPTIAFTKPPVLDNIDLIQRAAEKLELKSNPKILDVTALEKEIKEKWRKIDADIQQMFGPIQNPDIVFNHHSKVMKISVNDISMNYLERG